MFIKKLVVSMVILILSITSAFAYDFANGSGTEEAPYQIASLTDLIGISSDSDLWDKYFIQTADIDASSTSTLNEGAGFSPIGNYTNQFIGDYNGNEYKISYLYINRPNTNYIGLFGYTNGANITNIGLVDNNFSGKGWMGSLVAYAINSTTINNCYATGTVSGSYYLGGLVGTFMSSSTINNSYASGAVTEQVLLKAA